MSCFVYGCSSGYNSKATHAFKAPNSANKELWIRNIPKREIPFDFSKSRICYLHFHDEYIIKNPSFVIINGERVPNPARSKWTLKPNAVPTQFSNRELSIYYNKTKRRRSPTKRSFSPKRKKNKLKHEPHTTQLTTIYELIHRGTQLTLPNYKWIIQPRDPEDCSLEPIFIHEMSVHDHIGFISVKSVSIDTSDTIKVVVKGKNITHKFHNLHCSTIQDFSSFINEVDSKFVCEGVAGYDKIKKVKNGICTDSVWYSCRCQIIGDNKICTECKSLRQRLRVANSKMKLQVQSRGKLTPASPSKINNYIQFLAQRVRNNESKIRKYQYKSATIKIHMNNMKLKFRKQSEEDLKKAIEGCNLSENMKMSFLTATKIAKAKSSKGYRYESDWLLQCLLLKIRSPKAYDYLRDTGILPLPHPSTIQRLIRGVKCEFGFQDMVFNFLKNEMKDKSPRDRQGILIFDEMKVREALEYSKFNMKFHGFIDFADYTDDYFEKSKSKETLADHALVFMIRSLNSNRTQPIAAFASRSAAPANILSKLILSAIIKLEDSGLHILGITCDGASTNKSMWKGFGITGKMSGNYNDCNVIYQVTHPCNDSRKLHFLCDVPHIIKCIRNHLLSHTVGVFNGFSISFLHYSSVYLEETRQGSLRLAPKLTKNHIC